jgi:hypothetical protein
MSANYFEELGDIYSGNIIEEGEKVGDMEQLEQKNDALKHNGPESAENFEPADETEGGHNEGLTQEKSKKEVKKESNKINNSTMKENTNKSTFDRLFEDVMGGDLDVDLGAHDDMGGDDMGMDDEMGGEDVTITLNADQVSVLKDVLSQLDGGDDEGDIDDIEDIDDADGGDEFENMESHVELENAPDSVGHLTGKNNKAALSTDGGSAAHDAGGQEDGGKPKAAHDGVGTLTGKNNKAGNVKGGNAFSH